MADTPYPDLPPVPSSVQDARVNELHPAIFPTDTLPQLDPPVFSSQEPRLTVPSIPNEEQDQRNLPDAYLSIVYDPNATKNPELYIVAGVLIVYGYNDQDGVVSSQYVIPSGATTPGTLYNLSTIQGLRMKAPITVPTAWYLHVPRDISVNLSTVNVTLDTDGTLQPNDAFVLKIAQTQGSATNGRIQQLYAGVLHVPSLANPGPPPVMPEYTLVEEAITADSDSENFAGLSTILKRDGIEVGRSEFKLTSTGNTIKITSSES